MDGSSANVISPETVTAIVAIAFDDTFAHVYPDLRQLIEDGFGGPDTRRGALEFFSAEGDRLLPVFGRAWQLVDLRVSDDEPDADRLRQRLAAVVDHVTTFLRKHPEVVEAAGLTLDEAISQLPRPAEQNLAEVLARFPHLATAEDDGAIRPLDRGGWFHNSLHAAGWTH
ncbi:hypothetical protein ACFFMR_20045 [Micromonospora andamanensis]|uniref:Uncharacterized protein n=1 Tax=Micromonospora andamanensis TaxID=1287068 RepID=A0ABQ4HZ96_9ACTN|nr:hypothetical protein [Micromonospora andamanensis]GIJ10973.1 hypothetical protein Van01_41870 [Micromonospora andamanensis]GIJ41755.1 hypothetical protein Vwe01_50800 [Micromonospora andamanensis]